MKKRFDVPKTERGDAQCSWSRVKGVFWHTFPHQAKPGRPEGNCRGPGLPKCRSTGFRFGFNADASFDNPINNADTLSGLTQFSADGESRNTLLAAEPSASGIGNRDYGVAGGRAFLLTLVTTEDRVEEAVQIIKK